MYYVYVIRSKKNKRFYIGSTEDIERRLSEHNHGRTKSLKNKGPFELIKKEAFAIKSEAMMKEYQLKRYKSGNAFKKYISQDFGDVA